ncbi:MAG: hypothetical protein MUF47_11535 [Porphyrobacter sp.]|nr:hypothetical protein [Porphyrobacter sp.]
MLGRIIWAAAMAVLALVTVQLQLDRQAAREPAYAQLVMDPFRANAQFIIAGRALYRQDTDTALAEARKLVMRRPIPAEHLSLLAGAFAQGGQVPPAALAVQYAARRGWRDPIAQEARLRLALEAGDKPEAARRFVALMVAGTKNQALTAELGKTIFGTPSPEAEAVVVDLISETDRWHPVFLWRGVTDLPADAFARIAAESLARKTPFDCKLLASATAQIARRDPAAAETLARASAPQCPPAG